MEEEPEQGPEGPGDENALLSVLEDGKAMEVIRKGLNLRKPGCGDFWEDFIDICNDADGLSELLDVEREKISKWASLIKQHIEKVEDMDAGEEKSMVSTGDGPIGDPAGNDNPQDGPAETRPMP